VIAISGLGYFLLVIFVAWFLCFRRRKGTMAGQPQYISRADHPDGVLAVSAISEQSASADVLVSIEAPLGVGIVQSAAELSTTISSTASSSVPTTSTTTAATTTTTAAALTTLTTTVGATTMAPPPEVLKPSPGAPLGLAIGQARKTLGALPPGLPPGRMPSGTFYVAKVVEDSLAESSGLIGGDTIVAINGAALPGTAADATKLRSAAGAGSVRLTVRPPSDAEASEAAAMAAETAAALRVAEKAAAAKKVDEQAEAAKAAAEAAEVAEVAGVAKATSTPSNPPTVLLSTDTGAVPAQLAWLRRMEDTREDPKRADDEVASLDHADHPPGSSAGRTGGTSDATPSAKRMSRTAAVRSRVAVALHSLPATPPP
jgi:membrane-associated protease RseP (regulator of RpoE activity)